MSIIDNIFGYFNKKEKAVKDFENDKSRPSDSELVNDENSSDAFLDIIGNLALKQKIKSSVYFDQSGTDLTTVSLKDFAEIESTEQISKKIEELKLIIRSIESKSNISSEIELTQSYKIDYKKELNTIAT